MTASPLAARWRSLRSKKAKHHAAVFIVCGPRDRCTFIGKVYGHDGQDVDGHARLICEAVNRLTPEERAVLAGTLPAHVAGGVGGLGLGLIPARSECPTCGRDADTASIDENGECPVCQEDTYGERDREAMMDIFGFPDEW